MSYHDRDDWLLSDEEEEDEGGQYRPVPLHWKTAHLPPVARERYRRLFQQGRWNETDEESIDPDEAFLKIVVAIDELQAQIKVQRELLQQAQAEEPKLRVKWNSFKEAGGSTAAEFKKFLTGKFCHRPIVKYKHLRLVVG